MMKLKIGFSPCPNDTFIFHALLHDLIDTEGLQFEPVISDVEELNKNAFNNSVEVTKLSYFAFVHVSNNYILLNAGSALGNNCGPLLINTTGKLTDPTKNVIAIPGRYTTANFLLSTYLPEATNKTELLFSRIENAVLSGACDAGLIIHENRFTYEKKGLKKIVDLGMWWENNYNLPIPLGGIAVKRSLAADLQQKIDRVLKRSVEFAMKNPGISRDFVRKYSQELSDEVIDAHIQLYVNDYTVDLGEKGKEAIEFMIQKIKELKLTEINSNEFFVEHDAVKQL